MPTDLPRKPPSLSELTKVLIRIKLARWRLQLLMAFNFLRGKRAAMVTIPIEKRDASNDDGGSTGG